MPGTFKETLLMGWFYRVKGERMDIARVQAGRIIFYHVEAGDPLQAIPKLLKEGGKMIEPSSPQSIETKCKDSTLQAQVQK